MQITLCKAKLNKAKVTACQQHYSGSISIDARVLDELQILPYEKVLVVNRDTGARFETYVIPGAPGAVELHGGAALLGSVGDTIAVLTFALMSEAEAREWMPRVAELEADGRITHPAVASPATDLAFA